MEYTNTRWYKASFSNIADQGLVANEKTGENIAVCYDKKHATLIANAPELLRCLRNITNLYEELQGHGTAYSREARAVLYEIEGK